MIDAQATNNKILTDMINNNSKRFIDLNNNINMNLFKTSMENQVRLASGGNLLLEAQ
jgi:cell division protein YceG involved in septum cleavage